MVSWLLGGWLLFLVLAGCKWEVPRPSMSFDGFENGDVCTGRTLIARRLAPADR